MEFKRFTSLENTYRDELIQKIIYEGLNTGVWVALEKIHGANASFWYDGTELRFASRSQFVDGTFYNCQEVINRYSQSIKDGYEALGLNGKVLAIYGELYGDGIQKEVKYGPRDFRAFEVQIDGVVQSFSQVVAIAMILGINLSPIIAIGSFESMLAVPQVFRSFLTPDGCEGENEAEGITIQPTIPKWLKNGNRVWLKKKAPAFSEKKERTTNIPTPLPDDITQVLNDLLVYNTSNRVSNVISKIGTVTTKDFGKILGLTVKDMLEDYDKEHEVPFHVATEKHYKSAVKILNSEVSTVVRVEFVKHLEEPKE